MKFRPLLIAMYGLAVLCACKRDRQVHIQQKDIVETVYASGKIISDNEYSLFALVNGTIRKKLVKDGDTVRKGQLLYIVENNAVAEKYEAALSNYQHSQLNLSDQSPPLRDLRLSMQTASLQLQNDSLTYFRWKNLWESGIGTRSNLDNNFSNYQVSRNRERSAAEKYASSLNDMQVALSNARSQMESARQEWKDYYIRSDRDGVVYQTFKEGGEGVRASEVVALIGSSDKRIIRLSVDQEDIDKVRVGQRVLLKTDLSGNEVYEASIKQIHPTMNESDQTFRVDAVFEQHAPQPFIHGSVEANVIVRVKPKARVLAREAMADENSVWVLENGREKKMAVQTGISSTEYVEILSGLDEHTPVLIKNKSGAK